MGRTKRRSNAAKEPSQTAETTTAAMKPTDPSTPKPNLSKKSHKKRSREASAAGPPARTPAAPVSDAAVPDAAHDDANDVDEPQTSHEVASAVPAPALDAWRSVASTGGRLNGIRAVFSADSRLFMCASGADVKVFSAATSLVIRILRAPASLVQPYLKVVAMQHAAASSCVMVAYSGGLLALWDYTTGQVVKSWPLELEITHMLVHPSHKNKVFLILRNLPCGPGAVGPSELPNALLVVQLDCDSSKSETLFHFEHDRPVGLAMAAEGSVLVVAAEQRFFLKTLGTSGRGQLREFTTPAKIVSLAVHPSQPYVATGDATGRIHLWYCFNLQQYQDPVSSVLHWHAHQVNDLAFTPDGSMLLSGGEEAVLVLWQLETGTRQFLPRLGSEILAVAISSSQSLYATTHKDNSVHVITATDMYVKKSVAGIKCANVNQKQYPLTAGLVIDPRTSAIVLNGYPGSLQFYDAEADTSVAEIDVSPRNRITRVDDQEIQRPHVHHIDFTTDGGWMATIDMRKDKEFDTESYLKFWSRTTDVAQPFVVNTRVDAPHQGNITALKFRPHISNDASRPILAATAGSDKLFKIWELVEATNERENTTWICRSTGFYNDATPRDIAFSQDGSAMAVAYGSAITLWDPETNALHAVLAYSRATDSVIKLAFLNGNLPYLVAVTPTQIHVWNIVTETVEWSLCVNLSQLLTDPRSGDFLIIASHVSTSTPRFGGNGLQKHAALMVFSPTSPVPKFVQPLPTSCLGATYAPGAHGSRIVILDQSFRFVIFDRATHLVRASTVSADTAAVTDVAVVSEQRATHASLFTRIYGESIYRTSLAQTTDTSTRLTANTVNGDHHVDVTGQVNTTVTATRVKLQTSRVLEFLDAPTHIVAPPSKLIESFMDQLLVSRDRHASVITADDTDHNDNIGDNEVDDDDDVDDDGNDKNDDDDDNDNDEFTTMNQDEKNIDSNNAGDKTQPATTNTTVSTATKSNDSRLNRNRLISVDFLESFFFRLHMSNVQKTSS